MNADDDDDGDDEDADDYNGDRRVARTKNVPTMTRS